MQKRYWILKDITATGSFSASARENHVSYNTAWSISDKFVTTGDCQPGTRGRPDCKMQPFMAAYLEAMLLVNPFLYLEERLDRTMTDLNLLPNEVPSVPVICQTLLFVSIKTQVHQGPSRAVYTVQLGEKVSFCPVEGLSKPTKIVFRDETKSLNDQRLFSNTTGNHTSNSDIRVHLRSTCALDHFSLSERYPFQRFFIGLPNNAVSLLGATSRVFSGKCVLNAKTIGRWNSLQTHKESVFQGHMKIALISRVCFPGICVFIRRSCDLIFSLFSLFFFHRFSL